MTGNPVGWFEIYVQDMGRARRFYEAMLKVELERLDGPDLEMWTFPHDDSAYGTGGALVRAQGMAPGGNSTLVYFSCADCAEEAARAADAGGRLVREKFSIGEHGFVALVEDTEGNMLGLHSMR